MKSLLFSFVFIAACAGMLSAQISNKKIFYCSYGANTKGGELCNVLQQQNGFASNTHAENAVDKILLPIGLPRNFILVPCPQIQNATAVTLDDGLRYIVYDNSFMESIDRSSSNWSSLTILAHEIGHHLCGHTLKKSLSLSEQRAKELEADEFAGFVMFKLNAPLQEAEKPLNMVGNNNDDTYSDHPKLSYRLAAMLKGYNRAQAQMPLQNLDLSTSAEKFIVEGQKLRGQGDYQGALEKFITAINLNPNSSWAFNNRGSVKDDLKDYYEAIKDYNKAIQLDPTYTHAYYNRGITKYNLKDFSGAITDYDKAIQLDPNDVDTYNSRGQAKRAMKDYYSAISDHDKAIQLDPKNAYAYIYRGNAKADLKDYYGAVADYTKSIQLDPSNPGEYFNRGLAKEKIGDASGACQDYKKGCDLGYSDACTNYKNLCK